MNDLEVARELTSMFEGGLALTPSEQPIAILLSGFAGAGKTTITEVLHAEGLAVISTDAIRHELTLRGFYKGTGPFPPAMGAITRIVRGNLIKHAFEQGGSFVVDGNMTPEGNRQIKQSAPANYRVKTVFLTAPEDELTNRLIKRKRIPGVFKGNIAGLHRTMAAHKDLSAYDTVIDTSVESVTAVAKQILEF